jgi:hypothetical protein
MKYIWCEDTDWKYMPVYFLSHVMKNIIIVSQKHTEIIKMYNVWEIIFNVDY